MKSLRLASQITRKTHLLGKNVLTNSYSKSSSLSSTSQGTSTFFNLQKNSIRSASSVSNEGTNELKKQDNATSNTQNGETPISNANGSRKASREPTRAEILEYIHTQRAHHNSKGNQSTINYALSIGIGFVTLAYAAVPLYKALCSRTGFGGTPITDKRQFTNDKLVPIDTDKKIRIAFTSETSAILPWKFTPQQREVYLVPGETALAFYKAKNNSKKDIVGMATYSVTPGEAAPYFNKIQCFCFEEQKLLAGEEVDMPVFFFIDPDFAKDPAMRNIDDIVLHYTFFKAQYDKGVASVEPVKAEVSA